MRTRSLRRRIAVAFVGLAVGVGLVGGLLAVLFAYTTEDHIFNRLLALEAAHLEAGIDPSGRLPTPELPFARYYYHHELPAELSEPLAAAPKRREVFGRDGRHYHLRKLDRADPVETVWVVLEAQDYLVVRPVLTDITAFLGASILAMIAAAVLIGLYLAHRVTAPLRALAAEVDALEPRELPADWARRYPPDEVGQVAQALRDAFRRIASFIDREQRFTQDASHELRTPLAVVESSAEMLARDPDGPQRAVLIGRIQSATTAMRLSVEALLALAREAAPDTARGSAAVLPIVERTVVNHAPLLDGKPVEVTVDVDPDWRVAGDPAALQVLIANLVSNAFRYTERGEIRIVREGEDLVVIDSGVGIDETLRADVTRATVKSAGSPGLGLGLSIVERVCARNGWRFELASSDQGTTARLGLG